MKKIPYGRQWINDADIQAVQQALSSDWLTCGPAVTEFEKLVAEYCGAKHAVAVSNGTAALHVACLALDVGPRDVGVTSPLTFLASANCIAYCGGRPDFVDIDPETLCLSPKVLEEWIAHNGVPKVVIPVDFAGVPADLPGIWRLAQKYGFKVIEDAAHSLGSTYDHVGKIYKCGCCAHSDIAILSFHPVKTITSGEGGMVLTNDDELAKTLRMFANHGTERDVSNFENWAINNHNGAVDSLVAQGPDISAPWLYQQQLLGFNYRLTDIQCALGISQMKRLDEFAQRRREIVGAYNAAFSKIEGLSLPCPPMGTEPVYHLYVLRLTGEMKDKRAEFFTRLRDAGVYSQVHYIPVYLQPWYVKKYSYSPGKCSSAESAYSTILSLPLFPAMTDEDIDHIIASVLATSKGIIS